MIDPTLFDEIKKYFTKEFINLSAKKDEKLEQKVQLEVERKQEEDQLFHQKDTVRIKKLFSPLEEDIFEKEDFHSLKTQKNLQKIQNIENEIVSMEKSMEDIKKYLCFIQLLENEQKKEKENVTCFKEALSFLQKKYPAVDILFDFEEETWNLEKEQIAYLAQTATDTIDYSIETVGVDTVIGEAILSDRSLQICLQMLVEDQTVDQYSCQYEILQKEKTETH